MDLSALRDKIQSSRLLTDSEREYWLEHLPTMTDEQLAKLENILSQAAAIPWTEQMKQYISIVARGQVTSPTPS